MRVGQENLLVFLSYPHRIFFVETSGLQTGEETKCTRISVQLLSFAGIRFCPERINWPVKASIAARMYIPFDADTRGKAD